MKDEVTDIVERLRAFDVYSSGGRFIFREAADEIERLTEGRDTMGNLWAKEKAYSEILRAALMRIDGINDNPAHYNTDIDTVLRAALTGREGRSDG